MHHLQTNMELFSNINNKMVANITEYQVDFGEVDYYVYENTPYTFEYTSEHQFYITKSGFVFSRKMELDGCPSSRLQFILPKKKISSQKIKEIVEKDENLCSLKPLLVEEKS